MLCSKPGPQTCGQQPAAGHQLAGGPQQDLQQPPLGRGQVHGLGPAPPAAASAPSPACCRTTECAARLTLVGRWSRPWPAGPCPRGAVRPAAGPAARPWRTAWSRSHPRPRPARRSCPGRPIRPDSTMTGTRDQSRSSRMTSVPSRSGSPEVQQHRVRRPAGRLVQRLLAAGRRVHLVAARPQVDPQRAEQRGLVLHDQHPGLAAGSSGARRGTASEGAARASADGLAVRPRSLISRCLGSSARRQTGYFSSSAMLSLSTLTSGSPRKPEVAALGVLLDQGLDRPPG